jgi:hypothetical protein
VQNNENKEMCSVCGGKCCNTLPGNAHPRDFGFETKSREQILEELIEMFKTGNWQIDWWECKLPDDICSQNALFIRPATKKGQGRIYHGAWAYEGCIFHTRSGCKLSFSERPHDCKELIPRVGKCMLPSEAIGTNSKLVAIEEWSPYEDLIIEAAAELGETGISEDEDELGGIAGLLQMFKSEFKEFGGKI